MSWLYSIVTIYPLTRLIARFFSSFRISGRRESPSIESNLWPWLLCWVVLCGAVFAAMQGSDVPHFALPHSYGLARAGFAGSTVGLLISFWPRPPTPLPRTVSSSQVGQGFIARITLCRLVDSCCDELWRAFCIVALLRSGSSTVEAWLVTTVVFGIGRMTFSGTVATAAGSITGGVFLGGVMGAIFLRTGSIVAPLAARLTVLVLLLFRLRTQSPEPGRGVASFTCPHCNASLFRSDPGLHSSFQCKRCLADLRISPLYSTATQVLAVAPAWAGSVLLLPSSFSFGRTLVAFFLFYLAAYASIAFLLASLLPPHVRDDRTDPFQLFR